MKYYAFFDRNYGFLKFLPGQYNVVLSLSLDNTQSNTHALFSFNFVHLKDFVKNYDNLSFSKLIAEP